MLDLLAALEPIRNAHFANDTVLAYGQHAKITEWAHTVTGDDALIITITIRPLRPHE